MQHEARGGADRHGETVGDRVVDGDELAVEGPEGAPVVLAHLDGDRRDAVLLELRLEEGECEPRPDDGDVRPLAQQVGNAPDVVLVPVGEHDGVDPVEALPDPREVRKDHVDAGLVLLGEEHSAVDDEQPPGVLEHRHVPADLTQSTEGDDPQAVARQLGKVLGAPGPATAATALLPPPAARAHRPRPRWQGTVARLGVVGCGVMCFLLLRCGGAVRWRAGGAGMVAASRRPAVVAFETESRRPGC